MIKMTDSRAVEVLERLEKALPDIGVNGWIYGVAAVQHAIARLREPAEAQAQGGGEVVYQAKDETLGAWFDVDKARWDNYDSHLRRAVYTAPPSAPVGWKLVPVEPTEAMQDAHRMYGDTSYWWNATLAAAPALAQQPAAVTQPRAGEVSNGSGRPAAVDGARFRKAPCYMCGYNGAGYFQPQTHPCAALYHAAQPGGSDHDR